jgi:hypothetical protein
MRGQESVTEGVRYHVPKSRQNSGETILTNLVSQTPAVTFGLRRTDLFCFR